MITPTAVNSDEETPEFLYPSITDIIHSPRIDTLEINMPRGLSSKLFQSNETDIMRVMNVGKARMKYLNKDTSNIYMEIARSNVPDISVELSYDNINEVRDLLKTMSLGMWVGIDTLNNSRGWDLKKLPHLLVAGTTGAGKTVALNALLASILLNQTPETLKLVLLDPKMNGFKEYDNSPYLADLDDLDYEYQEIDARFAQRIVQIRTDMFGAEPAPMSMPSLAIEQEVIEGDGDDGEMGFEPRQVTFDPDVDVLDGIAMNMNIAADIFRKLIVLMEVRYLRMRALRVNEVADYNARVRELGGKVTIKGETYTIEEMPFYLLINDEMADLMLLLGKTADKLIAQLAQKARAAGIHIILATQRPSVDVITGTIKANLLGRLGMMVSTAIDSKTIGIMGCETLLGNGDSLINIGTEIVRSQIPYISDELIRDIAQNRVKT